MVWTGAVERGEMPVVVAEREGEKSSSRWEACVRERSSFCEGGGCSRGVGGW